MRYSLGFLGFLIPLAGAQTQPTGHSLAPVQFKSPVEVFFRPNGPVPGAEYRLIMEEHLIPSLDTLSFRAMLSQRGIYFAKVYTESVGGSPYSKYYKIAPISQGEGLYPFNERKVNVTKLERPPKGRFYTQKESATYYRTWMTRKDASDFGPAHPPDTLPGIDSVRVVYIVAVRPRWQRRSKGNAVK
jgi:hypothetical protein